MLSNAVVPFQLDDAACRWVVDTQGSLSLDLKLRQLLHVLCRDLSQTSLDSVVAQGVGGIHRLLSRPAEQLRSSAQYLQRRANIPLLLSGDLELSERFSMRTALPNQMGIAAAGGEAAALAGKIAASEGRALGFNWSFGPSLDLDINPANPVVNTRSFGNDVARVSQCATDWIVATQQRGMAAAGKHFPGDGVDHRDQHFVWSCNSLGLAQWRGSYGAVFKTAIDSGLMSIMASHITFDAYEAETGRMSSGLPASLNHALITDLLRGELGFEGVVISDSLSMAGFACLGDLSETIPASIAAGCDMLLFPDDVDATVAILKQAIEDGRLSMVRVDAAVGRVLEMKAALGLHKAADSDAGEDAEVSYAQDAADIVANSITLVRDDQAMIPLSAVTHRRILLLMPKLRESGSGPLPQLAVRQLLEAEGFEVHQHEPGMPLRIEDYDAAIYAIGDEAGSAKPSLSMPWSSLHGAFPDSMVRLWRKLPTAIISFGTPYYLHDAPECLTLINAYSPIIASQAAAVKVLLGRVPARGISPVAVTYRPLHQIIAALGSG
ncbi:glycoside hydrolase family 3 N-terminal domain-containing protein [Devosia sp.]|uniref:glycoside hydrolase family 3 protein n=1 Tax=Devosia sp. TaxID=1871048 RepID=UPI00262F7154|nr:glycoside hydrolase family 3 N-terminal domain-containing protein [Devosia sp.]